MPLPVIMIREEGVDVDLVIHCPFSGVPVDGYDGPCLSDTVFFVDHGHGEVDTNSQTVRQVLELDESGDYPVAVLIRELTLPGAFVLQVDHGWNGVFSYGFSPVRVA